MALNSLTCSVASVWVDSRFSRFTCPKILSSSVCHTHLQVAHNLYKNRENPCLDGTYSVK